MKKLSRTGAEKKEKKQYKTNLIIEDESHFMINMTDYHINKKF